MVQLGMLPDYLQDKISPEPNTGCWLWTSYEIGNGYGCHRKVYEALKGPIPHGLSLDHLCRVRCCVNPDHLEPVTHEENVRRGECGVNNRVKTHCPRGHEYTAGNTRVYKGKRWTGRFCRECERLRSVTRYDAVRKKPLNCDILNPNGTRDPKEAKNDSGPDAGGGKG